MNMNTKIPRNVTFQTQGAETRRHMTLYGSIIIMSHMESKMVPGDPQWSLDAPWVHLPDAS